MADCHGDSQARRAAAPASPAPITGELFCPHCGYNLRGLICDRCPECGEEFDRAGLSESRLPWAHRKRDGKLLSYVRTLLRAALWPRDVAAEFGRPVSYADAQRFRWVTVFFAWLPLGVSTGLYHATGIEDCLLLGSSGWITDAWLTAGFHVAAVLALAALTGVPSYFFHPRRLSVELQNRAIALSYYVSAPLGLTLVAAAAGTLAWGMTDSRILGVYVASAVLLLILAAWWRALAALIRRVLREEAGSTLLPFLLVPVLALAAGAGVLAAVFQLLRYAGIVFFSLGGV